MHRTEGTNHNGNMFTDGPPQTAVEQNWLNSQQEEMANVIEAAGLTLKTAATDTRDQLKSALDILYMPLGQYTRGALAYKSGAQTIGTGAWTAVTYDSEEYDDNSIHSTVVNTSRLTVPTGYSRARLRGWIKFEPGINQRQMTFYKNGGAFTGPGQDFMFINVLDGVNFDYLEIETPVISVNAADYFEVYVYHDHGSNRDVVASWFAMEIF